MPNTLSTREDWHQTYRWAREQARKTGVGCTVSHDGVMRVHIYRTSGIVSTYASAYRTYELDPARDSILARKAGWRALSDAARQRKTLASISPQSAMRGSLIKAHSIALHDSMDCREVWQA